MKYVCLFAIVFVCVVPVFLWPLEEALHPLPATLAEEGFEVAGVQSRVARSMQAKSNGNRKVSHKEHTAEKKANHKEPVHHSQPKSTKKPKVNRPVKPGKKDTHTRRHQHQKKTKNPTESAGKESNKHSSKPHPKGDKHRKTES